MGQAIFFSGRPALPKNIGSLETRLNQTNNFST
jgi:hypothetical protein